MLDWQRRYWILSRLDNLLLGMVDCMGAIYRHFHCSHLKRTHGSGIYYFRAFVAYIVMLNQ